MDVGNLSCKQIVYLDPQVSWDFQKLGLKSSSLSRDLQAHLPSILLHDVTGSLAKAPDVRMLGGEDIPGG